jgi:ATP-dependent DNA helicase RecQ
MKPTGEDELSAKLQQAISQYWGFSELRPMQDLAIRSVLSGEDSLVVLPTGGGKSLCYQAPAIITGDTTVVVSPLISLMKDQVDGLKACGIAATQLNSAMTASERSAAEAEILKGNVRLLFVSPERLVNSDFQYFLRQIKVSTVAIDEAHCISHWGHDFRPEYRQLRRLREYFPGVSVHAYTATATEQVRADIIQQLGLQSPKVLVGNFDRPNLTYRVHSRRDLLKQVLEVLVRHRNEAGVVYCIRRKEVDELTMALRKNDVNAMAYHAGLTSEQRRDAQEAFSSEKCDLIVATVAFGMGIDRSNVRFVLHTGMPKSLEHYQQETGRAGRDGLEAECTLLYSGSDVLLWKSIMEKSAQEQAEDNQFFERSMEHLNEMSRYSRGAVCRHRALVEYFGQSYLDASCGACDICLGETVSVDDADVIAQKIISCVARVKTPFGAGHIVSVLRGENTMNVRKWSHDQLSTFGLLKEHDKADIRDWIDQLVGQGALEHEDKILESGIRVPVVKLSGGSWKVLRNETTVKLLRPMRRRGAEPRSRGSGGTNILLEEVEKQLFEELRALRRLVAQEKQCQPYMVFNDSTLRDLCRVRPSSLQMMLQVHGIGQNKLQEFGQRFWTVVYEFSRAHGLTLDNFSRVEPLPEAELKLSPSVSSDRTGLRQRKELGKELFLKGASIEEVMQRTELTRATCVEHLCSYIRDRTIGDLTVWVDPVVYTKVESATDVVGVDRLKPIYTQLEESVSYDEIRLVLEHLRIHRPAGTIL